MEVSTGKIAKSSNIPGGDWDAVYAAAAEQFGCETP